MATISDITTTPLSGLNHIDALLDSGPNWNFLTPASNTISYTFSVALNNEANQHGQLAFSAAQQSAVRSAFDYISGLTGIVFAETSDATVAQVHLAEVDIAGNNVSGLCSWQTAYSYDGSQQVLSYDVQAYVYLDDNEFAAVSADLHAGGQGYETLLHELGHMLGLKHPFDGNVNLPDATDNTAYTLMAYNSVGGPYSTFQAYDVAALNWLYGRDGLGGALGIGSSTGGRYLTGTSGADTLTGTAFDDVLDGNGGNDLLVGGAGTDTAIFAGARSAYTVSDPARSVLVGAGGVTTTLSGIELVHFSNGTFLLANVLADSSAPAAPTLSANANGAGYVSGNHALLSGVTEAGATVSLINGANVPVGSATADAQGAWSVQLNALADGSYSVHASATDLGGNVSASSAVQVFLVDTLAPATPTLQWTKDGAAASSGSHPLFNGSAEAGASVELYNGASRIGVATAGLDGSWGIAPAALADGNYSVTARAVDAAGNASAVSGTLTFAVASANPGTSGTSGADIFTAGAGDSRIDGAGGIDTIVYAAPAANFTVLHTASGYSVTDHVGNGGVDQLINVERITFADESLAIDVNGSAGQAYRLYQAAFDRQPDLGGLGFWIHAMDQGGASLREVAFDFTQSAEFASSYGGSNPSNADFITKLYSNVLHRAPDPGGYQYWIDTMAHGASRQELLADFSEGFENAGSVLPAIQDGFPFVPYG